MGEEKKISRIEMTEASLLSDGSVGIGFKVKPDERYTVGVDLAKEGSMETSVMVLWKVEEFKLKVVDAHIFTAEFNNFIDPEIKKLAIKDTIKRWADQYGELKILKEETK